MSPDFSLPFYSWGITGVGRFGSTVGVGVVMGVGVGGGFEQYSLALVNFSLNADEETTPMDASYWGTASHHKKVCCR